MSVKVCFVAYDTTVATIHDTRFNLYGDTIWMLNKNLLRLYKYLLLSFQEVETTSINTSVVIGFKILIATALNSLPACCRFCDKTSKLKTVLFYLLVFLKDSPKPN